MQTLAGAFRFCLGRHVNLACSIAALVLGVASLPLQAADPLPRAHAHNDYLHRRPLLDALEEGFCSVEADIHLVEGQLVVAHDLPKAETSSAKSPPKTLAQLYLEPLAKRVRSNGGRVYPGNAGFLLLIDLKTEADATYVVLRKELAPYRDILTRFSERAIETNAVTIVLSGNRPVATVAAERERYVAMDGRIPDLETNPPPALVPLVSDNWAKFFQWRGTGPLPAEEKARVRELVSRAHGQGRRIRFWAVPDTAEAWEEMRSAGIDLINTDNLSGLGGFLRTR